MQDILLADVVMSIAFEYVFFRGAFNFTFFLFYFPMSLFAISLTFILHEYMHKVTAQHFGAIAAFKRSDIGLLITLGSAFLGLLFAIPGATMIYSSRFTKEEEGYVSIAGPLTNFAIFAVFFVIGTALFPHFQANILTTLTSSYSSLSYLQNMINLTLFIAILLAFYNMMPIFPLDGSKVFRWNKGVYAVTMIVIFAVLLMIIPIPDLVFSLLTVLVILVIFSLFYQNMFRF